MGFDDSKERDAGHERLQEYKRMAVGLKRGGDMNGALVYLKLSKGLETALGDKGTPFDLSPFPPIPSSQGQTEVQSQSHVVVVKEEVQGHGEETLVQGENGIQFKKKIIGFLCLY